MKVKPVVKYKPGMKVFIKDTFENQHLHRIFPQYAPETFTSGVIKKCILSNNIPCLLVEWESNSTIGDDTWWVTGDRIEVVE
jgi:hypothetical protein